MKLPEEYFRYLLGKIYLTKLQRSQVDIYFMLPPFISAPKAFGAGHSDGVPINSVSRYSSPTTNPTSSPTNLVRILHRLIVLLNLPRFSGKRTAKSKFDIPAWFFYLLLRLINGMNHFPFTNINNRIFHKSSPK